MANVISRRQFVKTAASMGTLVAAPSASHADSALAGQKAFFGFSLNTSTFRGHKLSLPDQIATVAKAGYGGIEPWVGDIDKFVDGGGKLSDIKKQCDDSGLQVINAIGFAQWIVNDDAARAKGMEQMKRDMDRIAQIGGTHIAAAPAGAYQKGYVVDPDSAAERYRAVLELGREMHVIPQLEYWGGSANLSRLDQVLGIAARAGHPDACVLNDVYHMYKGGSSPEALRLLGPPAVHNMHMNDYPANPPRETISDAQRIWPGEGLAPWKTILGALAANQIQVWLSLELFNADYWRLPAAECAATGLSKMKAVVAAAA